MPITDSSVSAKLDVRGSWLAAEQAARDLAGRESGCCSFFSFTFASADGAVHLDVAVPEARVGVLDALADRAAARIGS